MGWLIVNVFHQQIQVPRDQKNDLKEPRNVKVQNLVHSVGCSEGHRNFPFTIRQWIKSGFGINVRDFLCTTY